MSLCSFLADLREHGRVKVAPERPAIEIDSAAAEILREFDRQSRLEMAFEAPPFREAPAGWAATTLYRACQLFVFRETDDATRKALSTPCPEPMSPSVVYSVDLTLRFLPDLLTLVRAAADAKALAAELLRLAQAWPLSSVGIHGVDEVDVNSFISDPSLRQVYVDRIIARRDLSRATHPVVREGIRHAIGYFPALAPQFAAALEPRESAL